MPKARDYIGVALWHRETGSAQYYIDTQCENAAEDNAPIDAIYARHSYDKNAPREWVTVRDLREDHSFRDKYAQAGGKLP